MIIWIFQIVILSIGFNASAQTEHPWLDLMSEISLQRELDQALLLNHLIKSGQEIETAAPCNKFIETARDTREKLLNLNARHASHPTVQYQAKARVLKDDNKVALESFRRCFSETLLNYPLIWKEGIGTYETHESRKSVLKARLERVTSLENYVADIQSRLAGQNSKIISGTGNGVASGAEANNLSGHKKNDKLKSGNSKVASDRKQDVNSKGCLDLETEARNFGEDLRKSWISWEDLEDDYYAFYDSSKFTMTSEFDKVYHEVSAILPLNKTINQFVKVEKNVRLRHYPEIKITAPPDYVNKFYATLEVISEVAELFGGLGTAANTLISRLNTMNTLIGDGRREKTLPYDEGIALYKELMNDRQATLDNYRVFINQSYCKKILPLEKKLFKFRTETIPQSQCPYNITQASTGFVVRHTRLRNETHIATASSYCRKF